MRRMRRLLSRLAATTRFDLVHQLNPVDVGLSLAVAGQRPAGRAGPLRAGLGRPGARAPTPSSQPFALRAKRALRAAQQCHARVILLSTAAAAAKLEASWPAGLRVREVPPGIDTGRWHPLPQPRRVRRTCCSWPTCRSARACSSCCSTPSSAWRRGSPPRGCWSPAPGPRRQRSAGAWPHPSPLAASSCSARSGARTCCPLMQRCAVYCLPSYGEPFGMTALEAMACARPVVATRAGGLQHLVDDHGGRTVPPGDAPALATALAELLADPGRRASMGEHNRRRVEERYAWSRGRRPAGGRLRRGARLCLTALVVVGEHLAAEEPEDHAVAAVELVARRTAARAAARASRTAAARSSWPGARARAPAQAAAHDEPDGDEHQQ